MTTGSASPGRSVVVTGVGLMTPLGRSFQDFDAALFEGRSAVRSKSLALPGMETIELAAAACDFDETAMRSASRLPLDRGTAMALAAMRDAAGQAGLAEAALDHDRIGVFWGSGIGGSNSFDNAAAGLYAAQRRMRPSTVLTVMPNAAVAEIALEFGARGSAIGYACACASSAVAIGEAMRAIRGGWLDLALVGGHEAMLTPGLMTAWHAMRVLAPVSGTSPAGDKTDPAASACRPFSADRAGFALGEGAAAFVLESEAHVARRQAMAQALLSGYATTCDAAHLTNPDVNGQSRAIEAALRDAGLQAQEIGYLNAHGTATTAGDATEAQAIARTFGRGVPVSATKAIHGHMMGAGGAVELLAAMRALARGLLPPTAHLRKPDAAFALDFVIGEAREAPALKHALSSSFAFGGTNAVLIASRAD